MILGCLNARMFVRLRKVALAAGISMALLFVCAGCVRLGERLERVDLPPDAPEVSAVLADLADNERALRSFRATGTIMVQIPEVEAVQVSRESLLHYRHPGNLYVVGRRYGTRVLELTYLEDMFLIEFPTRREYCYRTKHAAFETLTSADIVREMFMPESWGELESRQVRMTQFDRDSRVAVIEIWTSGRNSWRRRSVLVEGAPWVIRENTLFDPTGAVVAVTVNNDWREERGVRYPAEIESTFPGESAWMRFVMRRVDVNYDIDPALFDVATKVAALGRRGFTQVDIFAGEGPEVGDLVE